MSGGRFSSGATTTAADSKRDARAVQLTLRASGSRAVARRRSERRRLVGERRRRRRISKMREQRPKQRCERRTAPSTEGVSGGVLPLRATTTADSKRDARAAPKLDVENAVVSILQCAMDAASLDVTEVVWYLVGTEPRDLDRLVADLGSARDVAAPETH